MGKTYILQKDLPCTKAGTNFIFDGYNYKAEDNSDIWNKGIVENTSDWFIEKKEKIFTEDDMRKCFEAASEIKELEKLLPNTWLYDVKKYQTFNDYIKTL